MYQLCLSTFICCFIGLWVRNLVSHMAAQYDAECRGEYSDIKGRVAPVLIAPPFFTSELDGGVCSTPRPLYPRYPLGRRLGGRQSQYVSCGDEKKLPLPGIEPGRPARSPSLYRLGYNIWTNEEESDCTLERRAQRGGSYFVLFAFYN
jgi:hypothetical protein